MFPIGLGLNHDSLTLYLLVIKQYIFHYREKIGKIHIITINIVKFSLDINQTTSSKLSGFAFLFDGFRFTTNNFGDFNFSWGKTALHPTIIEKNTSFLGENSFTPNNN